MEHHGPSWTIMDHHGTSWTNIFQTSWRLRVLKAANCHDDAVGELRRDGTLRLFDGALSTCPGSGRWFCLFPTAGPVGFQSLGAGAGSRGLAAFKIRNGTLEPWNPGTLEPWNPGTLEPRNPGTLEPWNPGTLKPWNPGTLEPWNPGTLEP